MVSHTIKFASATVVASCNRVLSVTQDDAYKRTVDYVGYDMTVHIWCSQFDQENRANQHHFGLVNMYKFFSVFDSR